jgi:nitrilase
MIIDPWGRIIAELPEGPGVITATIDLDYLAKIRAELPALSHRRLI